MINFSAPSDRCTLLPGLEQQLKKQLKIKENIYHH